MNRLCIFVLLLFSLILLIPLHSQITYNWGVVSGTQDSITAYVNAVNVSGNATLGIVMQNWPWVKLFVDGAWDLNAPDSTGFLLWDSLIEWDNYTEYISFNPTDLIPYGNHSVEVRRYASPNNYIPFLGPELYYLPNMFELLTYTPAVSYFSTDLVNASLALHNVSNSTCILNYQDNQWIQMYFDGVLITPSYQTNNSFAYIVPDETYMVYFQYNPALQITYGEHSFYFSISDYGTTPAVSFTLINPSGNSDETTPETSIEVYPNPMGSHLQILWKAPHPISLTRQIVCVYNLKGQKLKTINLTTNSYGDYQGLWDGTDNSGITCSSGIYFLRSDFNHARFSKKIILHH